MVDDVGQPQTARDLRLFSVAFGRLPCGRLHRAIHPCARISIERSQRNTFIVTREEVCPSDVATDAIYGAALKAPGPRFG
ncbi:MAG: hypothetical protein NT015_10000 [Alphaproteobacteria bacterium]|nr:hypothetical protein [Alphaproteobacteria bacterium]